MRLRVGETGCLGAILSLLILESVGLYKILGIGGSPRRTRVGLLFFSVFQIFRYQDI